jgi:AAA domain
VIPLGAVIVVDEAAMMPTRALEHLAGEAAWRRARLVLVGDRAQLPAIDAAGGFAALADRLGAVELTENRRQRSQLQRDVAEHLFSAICCASPITGMGVCSSSSGIPRWVKVNSADSVVTS